MENRLDLDFSKYIKLLNTSPVNKEVGKVTKVLGSRIEGYLPGACLGSTCSVSVGYDKHILVEVVGLNDQRVVMMPYGDMLGVKLGSSIKLIRSSATVKVGKGLLGRIIDATGNPLDNKGPIVLIDELPLYSTTVNPLEREPIRTPIDLGVKAINTFISVGRGQRMGIMAGSGVGKSVLLGMMARNTNADVNVIALIGERGREVKDFIEEILGPEGLKKSVVIVATGDENPLVRSRGAFFATAVAEYFANQGQQVLLTMDSVTRFAMAMREIGLSSGEPPASKGYTPSVFSTLPKLLERAGSFTNGGSITGLYTVLVEGDDMDEPIADAVRSIVDGHIVLNRKLAHKAHFPAIDVLQSTSRVMKSVVQKDFYQVSLAVRELMAIYREAEDLIQIGAYQEGNNPRLDKAVEYNEKITQFLKQDVDDNATFNDSVDFLSSMQQVINR
ncbi:MAG: FliI/YscN family ATPase [Bdellovibrionales bacterium]|nr:FliI/YscN family ATPase [Bdellovibrionales bacterium]